MDFNSCYEELQNLANEIGITVTDDTKPTELFNAVIKLLAAYIIGQPDSDEIAENTLRKTLLQIFFRRFKDFYFHEIESRISFFA